MHSIAVSTVHFSLGLGQEAVSVRPGLQLRDAIGAVRACSVSRCQSWLEASLHLLLSYTKGALWRRRRRWGAWWEVHTARRVSLGTRVPGLARGCLGQDICFSLFYPLGAWPPW